MGDDLKPCPWCGRASTQADISGSTACWVECYHCEAAGPVDTSGSLDNAADAWNRRPAEDALRARAEAAEARAAQAEVDARLMAGLAFAGFVARTSFSAEIVDASLLDELEAAGDHAAAMSDASLIAAACRILAAGGAA